MTEVENNIKSKAKLIDSTVFDSFKTLTSEIESERFNGSLSLLQHLDKNQDGEKHTKERDYTLTRLVRGLGASTFASRAGYFTTFVGFLASPANADIAHEQLLEILEKQLHVGKGIDKEDSDALIGHILLCGALLRGNRLLNATNNQLTECVKILVRASNHKVFHSSMAYKFLIDLLNQLNEEKFTAAMWPTMKKELSRPWERHTCNTTHFLLVAHAKYPDLVDPNFLQATLKTSEILTPLAYKHLGRLYWGSTALTAITHPAYDALSRFLLSVKRKALVAFWTSEINESLAAPNKIKEVVTLKLLTDFLSATSTGGDSEPIDVKTLLKLITPRFIKMIMSSLKRLKQQKHDVLITFYEEFFEALNKYFGTISDDTGRVEILQKFILHPGLILIEKYLPQKTVHQLITKLGRDGVIALFDIYKSVFLARLPKDPKDENVQWLNIERHHAAQMMQYLLGQKCVQHDLDWRIEQLKFLLTVSLFNVSSAGEAVKKEQVSAVLTKELWQNIKSMFYASLQMKLSNLKDEKRVLLALVEHANVILAKKSSTKFLKEALPENVLKSWTQMLETVQSSTSSKKLTLTFHILFLHMGLQLFREPDMAQVAIADLIKCMEKTETIKKQKKARKSIGGDEEEEPEWIEVVIDLFLHLLSQNTSFLRNVVNSVFPHLCPNLTLTSVHQVLAMLDMKDGKNPLSSATDAADDEESDEDVEMNSDAEQSTDEEEDDDDDDNDEAIEEDEGTVSDQLRNAVSTALGATMPVDNTDADSVDLNDMKDEEAERLDVALSAAFQLLKKSGTSASGSSKKKSKKERTTNTTVMHFRIRVLDLIEIYLKTNPALSISLEIMLALFNMIEYCTDGDLKPLSDKVDRVLKRLLALRNFENIEDVTPVHLRDLLKSLVEKKVNPITLSAHNQLLSKSFGFLISNSHLVSGTAKATPNKKQNGQTILDLIKDYAKEFIILRNPTISYTLLQDILKIRWNGVWQVGQVLAETGLQSTTTRSFRRTQAMELLALIYKNHGFISSDVETFNRLNKSIETTLEAYVNRLGDYGRISPKEFSSLVGVLSALHKCHKMPAVKAHLQWSTVGEQVQQIRSKVILVSVQAYAAFCRCLGIKMMKKAAQSGTPVNGKNGQPHDSEDDEDENEVAVVKQTKSQKRKLQQQIDRDDDVTSAGDNKKQRKLKKAERLRIASEGFNGFSFGSVDQANINSDEDLNAVAATSSEEDYDDDDDDVSD